MLSEPEIPFKEVMIKERIEYIGFAEPLEYPEALRKWWAQVLLDHGLYSCYAIPLFLPSDKEARQYVKTYGREIDLISGKNCLVLGLTRRKFKNFNIDLWGYIVDGEVPQGYGTTVSELFGIKFTQFPCMVIFEDIRSSNYIVITLKGMTVEEISEVMRELFSIIQKAISEKKSPLAALEEQCRKKKFHRGTQTIISELHSLVGKTFEIVIEAWIRNF